MKLNIHNNLPILYNITVCRYIVINYNDKA